MARAYLSLGLCSSGTQISAASAESVLGIREVQDSWLHAAAIVGAGRSKTCVVSRG
jgi:hypothetical protein